MRKAIFLLQGIWLFTAVGTIVTYSPVAVAGGVVARLIDGSEFDSVHGRNEAPLLLKFWATWCVACLKEMPAYTDLFDEYGNQVRFLAVNVAVSDPVDRVKAAVAEHGLTMPVAYDESGELWKQFGILGTPTYVLLGSSGETLYRSYSHDEGLITALNSALAPTGSSAALRQDDNATRQSGDGLLRDIDGNRVDLAPADDEVIVSYHFAIWCTSYVKDSYAELSAQCRVFEERISELSRLELPGVRLVGFVSTYSTDPAGAGRYRDKRGIDHPLIFDSESVYAAKFGSRSFPHMSIIAPGGDIVFSGNHVPDDIEQIIRNAARGRRSADSD